MKAADYQALHRKPTRAAPQRKTQSAAEMMDISRTPEERIIDGLICKVGQIVNYDRLKIEVRLDEQDYEVIVIKKKP
ncbi:hypothetical protein [Pontibacter beigongshangensis]|uniref:hypothetical protein n=1 Tax=Pontibacter beigongshangensis TaxID=2574733 RepID=UPI00164FD3C2|nr:hypothetical protein [Pontibacter beigongshangensis]